MKGVNVYQINTGLHFIRYIISLPIVASLSGFYHKLRYLSSSGILWNFYYYLIHILV
jgi:hypothetical protein